MDDQSRRDEHSSQDEQPRQRRRLVACAAIDLEPPRDRQSKQDKHPRENEQRRRLDAYAAIDLEPLKIVRDVGKTVSLRKRKEEKEDSGNNGHSAGSVGSAKGASRNSWEGNSRPASTTSIGSNASGGLAKRDIRLDDLPEDPECSSKVLYKEIIVLFIVHYLKPLQKKYCEMSPKQILGCEFRAQLCWRR